MEDRRQHPRQPVAWPVRLWLSEHSFVSGRVVEASEQGAWLYLNWLPSVPLRPDAIYRLDVQHPATGRTLMCAAEIRHIEGKGVGVRLREAFGLGVKSSEAFPGELLNATRSGPGLDSRAAHAQFITSDRRGLARILAAVDDRAVRETATNALLAEGHRVTQASTVAETLAAVQSEHPDVVLLDIGLPDPGGMTVLQSIRRDNPKIGVIAVCNAEDFILAFDSVHGGALDCLFKPLSLELLSRAVACALTTVRTKAV